MYESLLAYYQEKSFNPVPIDLSDPASWAAHVAKRRNLYERHLGIPLSFLRDRPVIEFGCNTGENALVLASFGARLTLVEPNSQALPAIRKLFEEHNLQGQVVEIVEAGVEEFETGSRFDLAIAEGFINCLPGRDQALENMAGLLNPGGLGVVAYDDRYGHFLEIIKRVVFKRGLSLLGIDDPHSQASLDFARRLFLEDFERINTSRPFEAWWADVLLNQFVSWEYLWSYGEVIPLIESQGCEFHACSPGWTSIDHFNWYKNVPETSQRHKALLDEWRNHLAYFMTGLRLPPGCLAPAPAEAADSVGRFLERLGLYLRGEGDGAEEIYLPEELESYLVSLGNDKPAFGQFAVELKEVLAALRSGSVDGLVSAYKSAERLRSLWGTTLHYISFIKAGR